MEGERESWYKIMVPDLDWKVLDFEQKVSRVRKVLNSSHR